VGRFRRYIYNLRRIHRRIQNRQDRAGRQGTEGDNGRQAGGGGSKEWLAAGR